MTMRARTIVLAAWSAGFVDIQCPAVGAKTLAAFVAATKPR